MLDTAKASGILVTGMKTVKKYTACAKRVCTWGFCAVILLLYAACWKVPPPDAIVRRCFDAMVACDHERAYNLFSFDDRSVMSMDDFIRKQESSMQNPDTALYSADSVVCDITNITVLQDTAVVTAHIFVPAPAETRFTLMFHTIHEKRIVDTPSGMQDEGDTYSSAMITGDVVLVREPGGWRIFSDWETQLAKEAQAAQERLDYMQKFIRISHITIHEGTYDRGTYLTARVKNSGQRIVSDIELLIVCINRDGKPRFSVSVRPVTSTSNPLGPGVQKSFKADLSSAPKDWAKIVSIKPVNCSFAD
jgi:hypothetical protein